MLVALAAAGAAAGAIGADPPVATDAGTDATITSPVDTSPVDTSASATVPATTVTDTAPQASTTAETVAETVPTTVAEAPPRLRRPLPPLRRRRLRPRPLPRPPRPEHSAPRADRRFHSKVASVSTPPNAIKSAPHSLPILPPSGVLERWRAILRHAKADRHTPKWYAEFDARLKQRR